MKKFLTAAIFVIIIICLAAGTYAWTRPQFVLQQSIENVADANTGEFTTLISVQNIQSLSQYLGGEAQVDIALDGTFSKVKDGRDALQSNVIVTAKTATVTLTFEGETRFVDDKAYIQVTSAPEGIEGISELRNKWLELPRGSQNPDIAEYPQGPLFADIVKEGKQEVSGVSTTHYQAKATDAFLVRVVDGVAQLLGTRLTEDQVASLRASFTESTQLPIDIWATPITHQLKQAHATLAAPSGGAATYTVGIKALDTDVNITAPEGAIPLQQILNATQTNPEQQ